MNAGLVEGERESKSSRFLGLGEGLEGRDVVGAGPETRGVLRNEIEKIEGREGREGEDWNTKGREGGEEGRREGEGRAHLSELRLLCILSQIVPEGLKDVFLVV